MAFTFTFTDWEWFVSNLVLLVIAVLLFLIAYNTKHLRK